MKTLHPALFSGLLAAAVSPVFAEDSARSRYAEAGAGGLPSGAGASSFSLANRPSLLPREDRRQSPVKVTFTLTPKGEAIDIRVVSSSGDKQLDQKYVTALSKTRLQPRVVDGVAVESKEVFLLKPAL